MKIQIKHRNLVNNKLFIDFDRFLFKYTLWQNDKQIWRVKKNYEVIGDDGKMLEMAIRTISLDPIPILLIEGEEVHLADKWTWREYSIVLSPLFILYLGGFLGAALGVFSTFLNSRLIRKEYQNTNYKKLFPILSTTITVLSFLIIRRVIIG